MDETGEAEWTEAYYAYTDEKYVSQMDQDSATLTYIYIRHFGMHEFNREMLMSLVKEYISLIYY